MYQNLRAEITRKGMSIRSLSEAIGLTYPTLLAKMNGTHQFTYPEVVRIRNVINPKLEFEYLFDER